MEIWMLLEGVCIYDKPTKFRPRDEMRKLLNKNVWNLKNYNAQEIGWIYELG